MACSSEGWASGLASQARGAVVPQQPHASRQALALCYCCGSNVPLSKLPALSCIFSRYDVSGVGLNLGTAEEFATKTVSRTAGPAGLPALTSSPQPTVQLLLERA